MCGTWQLLSTDSFLVRARTAASAKTSLDPPSACLKYLAPLANSFTTFFPFPPRLHTEIYCDPSCKRTTTLCPFRFDLLIDHSSSCLTSHHQQFPFPNFTQLSKPTSFKQTATMGE